MLRTIIQRPTIPEVWLPKHKIERTEIDGVRHYLVPSPNGEGTVAYQSVTTRLKALSKDGIDAWRERIGEKEADKIANRASRRGDALHKMCEEYLLNGQIDVTSTFPLSRLLFSHVHKILDQNLTNLFGVELGLYSHILKAAGTVDVVAGWNGELVILDFKTSTKKKAEKYLTNYFYQTTAYAIMFQELYGVMPKKIVLVFGLEESPHYDIVVKDTSKYLDEVKAFLEEQT